MAIPEPANVAPWYLRNITQALALDESTGNVYVRTGFTGNIVIEGNVNIPGEINAHITEVGTSGNLLVPWLPVSIDGNSSVNVTGNVNAIVLDGNITANQGTSPWVVTGTVTANLGTNANVAVSAMNPAYLTAFEEQLAVTIIPDIQLDAVYGYEFQTMANVQAQGGTASANATTSLFSCSSGNTANAIGSITSLRVLKYRPGQGAMGRITAAFTADGSGNGVANTLQVAGFIQDNQAAYGFGFSGDTASGNTGVGILHMYNGLVEVRTLTVTTAAGGTQTGTVTLNGTSYTVNLTNAAGNAQITAAQIASGNTWGSLWNAGQTGNTIVFTATQSGPRTGSYSLSSTGAGAPAAGTFSRTAAGVTPIREWTYQAVWNGTPISFNPTKLNVYAIDYRWLGAGIVRYFMEDPISGAMTLVHTQHWANNHNIPHQNNPSFRIGIMSENVGGASAGGATVQSASMMAAIQGQYVQTTYSRSWAVLDSTTRVQNTLHHLLSIRNPFSRSGKLNMQELLFQNLSAGLQCNDPSVVYVFINGVPSTPLVFNTIPSSVATYSQTEATFDASVSGPVAVFTLGINGSTQFDLLPYRFVLEPGDVLSVCFYSTAQATRSSCALTWSPE